jgi:exopolysaccharide/PEP-CTERM locus tyrosine autokinase
MGRIEEAVRKLQRAAALQPTRGNDAPMPEPPRLGTVVEPAPDDEQKRIQVDLAELRRNELLAPDTDARRLEEQYRAIKRPLLRNADARREPAVARGNVLMVASALSGEGKTFTCVNLCLSIAREKDWDVVLVDADCSKPQLTRLFSSEQERGLLDLLRDPAATFDSAVMSTDIPGFSFMPAGTAGSDASELLASKRMDDLCAELATHPARMVVFDSSPLLLTSEAAALAAHVGQIAFVVRANETSQQAVLAAIEKLDRSKAVGCILNRTYGSGLASGADEYGYASYGTYGG